MTEELKKEVFSILVADDDESMRDLFKRIFSGSGFVLDIVEDGAKAIEKVKTNKYDIAFIDIVMPGINGYLAFCEMKKIAPSLKVVMITGYLEEPIIKASIKEGAYGCLYKPFPLSVLFKFIEMIKSVKK